MGDDPTTALSIVLDALIWHGFTVPDGGIELLAHHSQNAARIAEVVRDIPGDAELGAGMVAVAAAGIDPRECLGLSGAYDAAIDDVIETAWLSLHDHKARSDRRTELLRELQELG